MIWELLVSWRENVNGVVSYPGENFATIFEDLQGSFSYSFKDPWSFSNDPQGFLQRQSFKILKRSFSPQRFSRSLQRSSRILKDLKGSSVGSYQKWLGLLLFRILGRIIVSTLLTMVGSNGILIEVLPGLCSTDFCKDQRYVHVFPFLDLLQKRR